MTKETSETLQKLKTFRELSTNQKEHSTLIKEKKIILYAATLLESDNVDVLKLCLEILENFVANEEAHEFLISTFGVYEALETLAMRFRSQNEEICKRATEITDILRSSAPPAYNTRNRIKTTKPIRRNQLFLLYIEKLTEENRHTLERTLIKIKGVISVLVDIELKRCTVRICPKINIKEVIEKLYSKCELKAVIITKNIQEGNEDYCDVLEQTMDRSYLEYPEENNVSKAKAIATAATDVVKNGTILKTVVDLWNKSFYW